jgi:hypothetical protein
LTTKGVRHLRRLIEAGQRPSAARSPTGDGKAETLRPRWDTAEGELRLGTELMHEFEKAAPAVTPFLDAFEAAGWTTDCLPIPLGCEPTESDKEFRARTETTVKNLNRTLRDTPLHFRLTRDRKGVHYEYLPDRDQEPGRHR